MSAARLRIGLTGGIASGKSTVANLFAALGVPIVDADLIAREVVAPGQPLLAQISQRWGPTILAPDGTLNRAALRDVVFADAGAREALEALTHPAIRAEMERQALTAEGPYAILAIPLLVESRQRAMVHRVLVVDCEEATQIRRLQGRDGSTLEQVQAILAAQATRTERLQAADDVIRNDGDLHALRDRVAEFHAQYLELASTVYGDGTRQAE